MSPFALLGLASLLVTARQDPPPSHPTASQEETIAESPRSALRGFLEACRAGDFERAARFLAASEDGGEPGAVLARRLKAVLDRHVWFDLETISADPDGNLSDGLAPELEEVGQVPGPRGTLEPVRLERRADGAWAVSSGTVARIPRWFSELPRSWLIDLLPGPLLGTGPLEVLWWQWIALALLLTASALVGSVLAQLTRHVLGRIASRTSAAWDDIVLGRLSGPLTVGWALALIHVGISLLGLGEPARRAIQRGLSAGLLLVFFWSLSRTVDVLAAVLVRSAWAASHTMSRSLIPLAARLVKVGVIVLAVLSFLAELGFSVTSLLAGLGIGGLALALAAQKTVENLFGAFSIGTDQPFREGDFVRIDDLVGTVEVIGLRSTRLRTLDRTLVSIPNGQLADMRIESFSARDRFRLACTIGLVYDTSAASMRQVLSGLESVLRSHAKIWPDAVVVRFKEFGASSLDIEVMAWFVVADWSEFQLVRQEVLLQFMEVVERAETAFAFPTRTLHIASPARPDGSLVHTVLDPTGRERLAGPMGER